MSSITTDHGATAAPRPAAFPSSKKRELLRFVGTRISRDHFNAEYSVLSGMANISEDAIRRLKVGIVGIFDPMVKYASLGLVAMGVHDRQLELVGDLMDVLGLTQECVENLMKTGGPRNTTGAQLGERLLQLANG